MVKLLPASVPLVGAVAAGAVVVGVVLVELLPGIEEGMEGFEFIWPEEGMEGFELIAPLVVSAGAA